MPKVSPSSKNYGNLRDYLGLNNPNKKPEWDALRKHIDSFITEYVDLSPTSESASHQNVGIEKVKVRVIHTKAQYFPEETRADSLEVLRAHIMKQINNMRFAAKRRGSGGDDTQSLASHDQSMPGTPRSVRLGENPSTPVRQKTIKQTLPYSTPRRKKYEEEALEFTSDDEDMRPPSAQSASSSSARRTFGGGNSRGIAQRISDAAANHVRFHVNGATSTPSPFRDSTFEEEPEERPREAGSLTQGVLATPTRPPLRDLDPSDPRLVIPPLYEEAARQLIDAGFALPPPPRIGPITNDPLQHDDSLMSFLTFACQRPLPHLYPYLVAFGCKSIDEIQMMSAWSYEVIDGMMKELKGRMGPGDRGVVKPIDWHILAYSILSLRAGDPLREKILGDTDFSSA
ncbi:hypothetical protein BDN72DRAFT_845636 [Pluteus cervinus]|uniref:Uncharacterized protein n=1 Tax=Pluteus cervinus TaxID=181527 RepID=A0ACD3AHN7_9AGAR|nr:hypothetical protein BDN72DRAFT_845636 [Pluteus cervinus]